MRVYDETGREYKYTYESGVWAVDKTNIGCEVQYLEFDFEDCDAAVGDEGWYLIGDVKHTGSYLCKFNTKAESEYILRQDLMPILGIKHGEVCRLAVCEGMRYNFFVRLGLSNGKYHIRAQIKLNGDVPYEDPALHIFNFSSDADYSDMAECYRNMQLQRGCVPIKERVVYNSALDYAADAPEIRIRMGWKPVPSPIEHQTLDNEPQMKVACTFDRVREFVDALHLEGVKKAQICLVGWNKSGHDGRYPDLFPVEETLGGEDALRALIKHTQSLGYKIVCHTNSTDCYTIASNFSESDVIKRHDGTLADGKMCWSGGKMYHLCAVPAYKNALNDLPHVRDLGFEGLHYIDVISAIAPRQCYDTDHPLTAKESAEYYKKIGKLTGELFGGFSSEGAFDYTASYLDYALYVTSRECKDDFFDIEIPFWQLVYHGIVLSNASTHTINYVIKRKVDFLKYIEYGCRPSFYLYSKFMTNSQADWLGKEDLSIDNSTEILDCAKLIKSACDEYDVIKYLQRVTMVNHKIDGSMHTVTYSDGSRICVDYDKKSYTLEIGCSEI